MSLLISASTLPPKIENLLEYVEKLNNTEVDYIHCDIMDGKFVKNKTFDHKMVQQIKNATSKKIDVHLMVQNPSKVIKKYLKSKADIISIHFESYKDKNKLIKDLMKIKKGGAFSSIAFNPATRVEEILPYIYYCDMLLVMSVVAGKGGQQFMPETFSKLQEISNYLQTQNIDVVIGVDGGINKNYIKELKQNNVNLIAVGNYLYNSEDINKEIKTIKTI